MTASASILAWSPFLLAALLMLGAASAGSAQLISPGKLATAHEDLDGLRNCTQCHVLRQRGISPDQCLSCHVPLKNRLDTDQGFHSTLVEEDCAACHKDHFGRDFALVRFDTLSFDHERAGTALLGSHARLECSACHQEAFIEAEDVLRFESEHGSQPETFLGLATTCVACHVQDDPHLDQFPARSCSDCHGEETWEGADRFSHDETRYRLTGQHTGLSCRDCHAPLTPSAGTGGLGFTSLAFSECSSCHADVHAGARGPACAGCHETRGWSRVDRPRFEAEFDHSTTAYTLAGAHEALSCGQCHAPSGNDGARSAGIAITFVPGTESRAYPHPAAQTCTSCHLDVHEGVLIDGPSQGACASCHSEVEWLPVRYDDVRHNRETTFELSGAHASVPCVGCHTDSAVQEAPFHFAAEGSSCLSCHRDDDPHRGQFGDRGCSACHGTDRFVVTAFDHDTTQLPLDETHNTLACTSCHVQDQDSAGSFVRYRPIESRCRDCHGGSA